MVHPELLSTQHLDESVYKQIVAFFQNKIQVKDLTDASHNILNAVGGDQNQSIATLEIAEDVKERLLSDKIVSGGTLSKLDLTKIINRDYKFSDIGKNIKSVVKGKWNTYISDLFKKLQPSFNAAEKRLPMAKQKT